MRTLLTGELTQAQDPTSDYYVKLEVQNGSGTWIDVGAALGTHWLINAAWGAHVDQKIAQATFTLIDRIGSASMAPLMSTSALNVDDHGAYAPLLDIGRLVRANQATMPHGVALDVSKYREIFTGRIDQVSGADSTDFSGPITVTCADLGAWLQDLQIETPNKRYGSDGGTALESVIQSLLTDNIPVGDPAVTLVKESASSFAALTFTQDTVLLFDALAALVLDSTGEDLRYRYDASHVSQFMWFNPDRSRVTVDATFSPNQYLLRALSVSIANVRNVIQMPYIDAVTSATKYATGTNAGSLAKRRRRFNQIPSSSLIRDLTSAQKVVDAVANDLGDAPAQVAADLPYFFWPVQLYDRYTFQANNRQYDQDQTFSVTAYQHTIQNGQGATSLTLSGHVVGAYAEWLNRLSDSGVIPQTASILRITPSESTDGTTATLALVVGAAVDHVQAYYRTVPRDTDAALAADFSGVPGTLPVDGTLIARPVDAALSFDFTEPLRETTLYVRLVPWYLSPAGTVVPGDSIVFPVNPAPPSINVQLHATKVSGTLANLSLDVAVGVSDIPASLTVIEIILGVETALLTVGITGNVTLDAVSYPVLANRSIPNGVQSASWRAVLTDVSGVAWRAGPVTALSDVPSLTAEYKPLTASTGQIVWTCTAGVVLLAIDGGAPSTPSASPIPVTLDGSTHNYAFTASLGGQTMPENVTVPALPASGIAGSFTALSTAVHSTGAGTSSVRVTWAFSTSATFDVYTNDPGYTGHPAGDVYVVAQGGSGVTSPFDAPVTEKLSPNPLGTGSPVTIGYYVVAHSGVSQLGQSTKDVNTYQVDL